MRYTFLPLACLALLTASGCVETEKPPYSAGDIVFDAGLLGEWVTYVPVERGDLPPDRNPSDKTTHRIERAAGDTYRSIELGGKKEVNEFTVFKLGDRYFMASKQEGGRFFVERLTVSGDVVKIWPMNVDHVLAAHPNSAKHKVDGFATVLTGSTDEVRAFLEKHADDPGVWNRKYQMMRRVEGLKVTAAGLTGRKQRTLDYWAEVRLALQDPAPPVRTPRTDLSVIWTAASFEIGYLSTDGVDVDAKAGGKLATDLCDAMSTYTSKQRPPSDPLASLIRESTGGTAFDPAALPLGREEILARVREGLEKLEMTRKKLTERYKCEFPPIR